MTMRALDRKLLRELRHMWSQALTIALVVGAGVAGFIMSFSAYDSLSWSRDRYYAEDRFADVFASLKRAPRALLPQLQQVSGVAQAEVTIEQVVQVDVPGRDGQGDAAMGRLIGIDVRALPQINRLHLRAGRMLNAHRGGAIEVLISETFAIARRLQPGDRLSARLNGKREDLIVAGIALSPEYVFAGLAGSPDQRGFGVFWLDQEALGAAYDMKGAFNHVVARLAPGANERIVVDGFNRLLLPYGGVSAHGRDEQMSHLMLSSEINQQRVMGTVLPCIFLAVAAFLLNVVLSRHIAIQREQIATLKALGYDNGAIGMHYLKLMLLIVALGLALGLGLGAWLGKLFMGLYAEAFRFPVLVFRVRIELFAVAAAIVGVAASLATWFAIRNAVRLAPAEAMRPPVPGRYRVALVEAWGLRGRLSPAARMIVRNMQRKPLRTVMTVLGMTAAIAVVVSGVFWRDTIDFLVDTQFRLILRGDVTVSLVDPRPATALLSLARLPHVTMVEGARSVSVRLVNGQRSWRGAIQGRDAQPELLRVMDVAKHAIKPPVDALVLTDRLAQRLGLRSGDSVRIELQEGDRRVLNLTVVGTVTEMMGLTAYIERRSLNRLLGEGDLINQASLAVERAGEPALMNALRGLPRVAVSTSKAGMLANIEAVTARNLLIFSAILTLFATVIAVGVVYNQARIALAERAWELASLRVLGFTQREVAGILLGELAIEVVLAIPLGLVGGYWLASGIIALIKNDEFFFPVVIAPSTYAYAALCMVAAGAVSALIVYRRIRELDLVGVLKTRE